jgi:pantetheine-phosphate adenylyltransferase
MPDDKTKGLYAGTFDPITNGHVNIIERSAQVFGEVIVAVTDNPTKDGPLFALDERLSLVGDAVGSVRGVEVMSFHGLTVEFARKVGANVIVRGLRAVSDFEDEFAMALANRDMAPEIDTVFLMTAQEFFYISSSRVKEIASLNGDVGSFVPPAVAEALYRKYSGGRSK